MRKQIMDKTMMCNLGDFPKNESLPVILNGLENEKTVLWYEDGFDKESIYKLINEIELARQVKGYSEIDLYFCSNGGYVYALDILVDYLNHLEEIKINLIVSGMVASCGFFLVFLVDNENIEVTFGKSAQGMVHLPDILLSNRDQKSKDDYRFNETKLNKEYVDRLSQDLHDNVLVYLGINKETIDRIMHGDDVYFDRDELSGMYEAFIYHRYLMSQDCEDYIDELEKSIESLKESVKNLKADRKRVKKVVDARR